MFICGFKPFGRRREDGSFIYIVLLMTAKRWF